MSASPRVSVVIAAANAANTLPVALRSIDAQTYDGSVDVIVAAADEPTAQVAKSAGATVIENPSGRTPTGLNLAVDASDGEILVRVDAHATLPPHYIERAVSSLLESGAENVGGMQVPVGTTFLEKAVAAAMSSPFGAGDARYRVGGRAGPADTVYLGAFRRAVFEEMGGYDQRYLRHQDYELNHRIQTRGGVVWFDPALKVEYRPRSSLKALASQYFQYGRWKRFFARQNQRSLRPRQMAPPLLVIALGASLPGSIWWSWLLAIPVGYVLALVGIGIVSLTRIGAPALAMPLALMVMHVSWGLGFLVGQTSDS